VAGVEGSGRARVQVAADLDFNRVESRSETFDPESRVVRSTQTRAENQATTSTDGQVSVGRELPGANQQNGAAKDASTKNEEIVNYEISRTTRTEVVEGGRLKRLSVAVLLDGTYGRGANGEASYQPRSQEELDRIGALVRSAVGFNRERGDQLEVVNLRFAEAPPLPEAKEESLLTSLLHPTKEDVLRLIENGVIAILTLIVLMTVVRPMLKRVLQAEKGKRLAAAIGPAAAVSAEPGEARPTITAVSRDNATAKMLQIAKVNGEIQAEAIDSLGEMVKGNPQETVAVLRSWIHD
jgi:flagellar M-ring protein FliF